LDGKGRGPSFIRRERSRDGGGASEQRRNDKLDQKSEGASTRSPGGATPHRTGERIVFRKTAADTNGDLLKIETALKQGPEVFGYETALWTAPRVTKLIEEECGVRYHPSQVWRILRKLGWSCQRPVGRALERDEGAIRQWKKVRWPQIKKKRCGSGGKSSSSTKAG